MDTLYRFVICWLLLYKRVSMLQCDGTADDGGKEEEEKEEKTELIGTWIPLRYYHIRVRTQTHADTHVHVTNVQLNLMWFVCLVDGPRSAADSLKYHSNGYVVDSFFYTVAHSWLWASSTHTHTNRYTQIFIVRRFICEFFHDFFWNVRFLWLTTKVK